MSFRRSVGFLAVLLVLAAAGCPDSERTSTGNAVVELRLEFSNPELGDDMFTAARGSVSQVILLPLDEESLLSLGDTQISALSEAESERLGAGGDIDLTQTASAALHIVSGEYLLKSFQLEGLQFVADSRVGQCADGSACDCDEDPGAPGPGMMCVSAECASCTVLACGALGGWTLDPSVSVAISDLGKLKIVEGNKQVLRITIDTPKLAVEFIEALGLTGSCGGLNETERMALEDSYPTYLTVELL